MLYNQREDLFLYLIVFLKSGKAFWWNRGWNWFWCGILRIWNLMTPWNSTLKCLAHKKHSCCMRHYTWPWHEDDRGKEHEGMD